MSENQTSNISHHTIEEIREVCLRCKFKSFEISDTKISIHTLVGSWVVILEDGIVTRVDHKRINLQPVGRDEFHKQPTKLTDAIKVLRYIYKHDKRLLSGNSNKSRVDKLFSKIEEERLSKQNG